MEVNGTRADLVLLEGFDFDGSLADLSQNLFSC
jgi:hypothetical protein